MTQGQTPPGDPTAVIGRRIVAYIIDAVIAIVLMVVVFAMLASSEDVGSARRAQDICDLLNNTGDTYFCINADTTVILADSGDIGTVGLVALVYFLATQWILPSLTGFSPGKAMVGLRIVAKESFAKAGLGANLLRSILWVADSAPWCFPLVGLITGITSNGHRRVGDMAAGTLVIDRKWVGQPLAVPGVNSVVGSVAFGTAVSAPPFSPPPPSAGVPNTPPLSPPVVSPPPPMAPPVAPPVAPPSATPPPPPAGSTMIPPTPTPPSFAPEPVVDESVPGPTDSTGVDAPQWDDARDTYIQWDPELAEWMEWDEAGGSWVPISQ